MSKRRMTDAWARQKAIETLPAARQTANAELFRASHRKRRSKRKPKPRRSGSR
jgi:hypothetical protein